ncbi:MAG: queuosine precursor transporter [Saprospiraceae bacterium]|nr:queuosine precursor transporter [Saprospiraceae bacterium]
MLNLSKNKQVSLFIVLAGIFITNVILAEFLGVKIFSLEKTLGFQPVHISLFGFQNLSFNLTTGVLIWPVVFVLTDLINEYYGPKGVRFLSYLAAGLILFAFVVVSVAIQLVPADFWPKSHLSLADDGLAQPVQDLNHAYKLIFGQGMWIIVGSLVAFLVGQILDVFVFHKIKENTGEGKIWLRATGSTLISQFIDSYVVLWIAFYLGAGWPLKQVLAIGTINYLYKFIVAILTTPVIYIAHYYIDRFLGEDLSKSLKEEAIQS